MKFQTQIEIIGMKASKGVMDNGRPFDSCKVYSLVDLDASKGTAKGKAAVEYAFGLAEEFDRFKNLDFPVLCDVTLEITSNGKSQMTRIVEMKPVLPARKAIAA